MRSQLRYISSHSQSPHLASELSASFGTIESESVSAPLARPGETTCHFANALLKARYALSKAPLVLKTSPNQCAAHPRFSKVLLVSSDSSRHADLLRQIKASSKRPINCRHR